MMTILILHGIEGCAGIHWQQWLHDELVKSGNEVIMPDLPDSAHPDRKAWFETVRKEVENIKPDELVIVGHSLGVVTALDLLEKKSAKALVSVAGFASDYGKELNGYFLKEKDIDFSKVKKNLGKAFVIYGDDDPYVPTAALKDLAERLNVASEVIHAGGHFNSAAGYKTFPRLLEIIHGI
ncbi:MAG: alpha/beta fold hydrolase [Candidatus Pacebacteria bacterium]|jgi:hypothetical protein|nr:alpha/beta fold hydrolase [Candidatus Paceibacterota bacterium]